MKLDKEARRMTEKWYDLLQGQLRTATEEFRTKILGEIMLDRAANTTSPPPCIYPDNCRFLYQDRQCSIVVIEQKPQVRSIYMAHNDYPHEDYYTSYYSPQTRSSGPYALSFPYVVLVISFQNMGHGYVFREIKVAYNNKPLGAITDMLYRHNLPNPAPNPQGGGGGDYTTMCMGEQGQWAHRNQIVAKDSLPVAVNKVITHFWSSLWTGDPSGSRCSSLKSVNAWKKATENSPLFILKVDWAQLKSLDTLVKGLISYYGTSNKGVQSSLNDLYARCWREAGKTLTPATVQCQIEKALEGAVKAEVKATVRAIIRKLKGKKAKEDAQEAMKELLGE